jgi:hypothetical protein
MDPALSNLSVEALIDHRAFERRQASDMYARMDRRQLMRYLREHDLSGFRWTMLSDDDLRAELLKHFYPAYHHAITPTCVSVGEDNCIRLALFAADSPGGSVDVFHSKSGKFLCRIILYSWDGAESGDVDVVVNDDQQVKLVLLGDRDLSHREVESKVIGVDIRPRED